jgi:sugar lactone lactonase YvrE
MRFVVKTLGVLVLVVLGIVVFAYLASKVDPVVWTPAHNPGLSGDFAANTKLDAVDKYLEGQVDGPEDITRGPDDMYYTGSQNGMIVRFAIGGEPQDFINTGGRPLGMQFDANGNLIVADSFMGLISIAPNKDITVLADAVNGKKMIFVDDLDIAADGIIWFSDASQRFDQHNFVYDFIEARATGRLLSYNPATKALKVELDDLFFANGVALGPNDSFVLVNETGAAKIHRLWLKGSKAGTRDLFFDGLPAGPDNLSFNGSDTFWVALPLLRQAATDGLAGNVFIRKLLGALPASVLESSMDTYGQFIGLDVDGNVKYNIQSGAGHFHTVTSVNQFGDNLLIGSLRMNAVGVYPLELLE